MNIGIMINIDKDICLDNTRNICEKINKRNMVPYVSDTLQQSLGNDEYVHYCTQEQMVSISDFIICIGGDGTFIDTARKCIGTGKPIAGINKGTMGFLTTIEMDEVDEYLDMIAANEYVSEKRTIISGMIGNNINYAVNDIVISRMNISNTLILDLYIDDKYVNTISGDGIIISTPTGSTAYSLSAGGPITEPDADLLIVTPICPHSMSMRPYVVRDDRKITLVLKRSKITEAYISFDGALGTHINENESVVIKKSNKNYSVALFKQKNFYSILKHKFANK